MIGGYIRKIGCSIRPYEKNRGVTDRMIQNSLNGLYDAFRQGKDKGLVLEGMIADFESIETVPSARPKVAIFGDLYVRDNDLMNQNLIKMVEENWGEVITTPYSEYMKIAVNPASDRFLKQGHLLDYARLKFLKSLIPLVEDKYRKYFLKYNGEAKVATSAETDLW